MRKKYQSYRILPARTVSATGPRICGKGGGGAAATASAAGAKVFGGSRLKTLFGISKGGAPPASASDPVA